MCSMNLFHVAPKFVTALQQCLDGFGSARSKVGNVERQQEQKQKQTKELAAGGERDWVGILGAEGQRRAH